GGSVRAALQWDWKGAEADFRRALALTPESALASLEYARNVLRPMGRAEEAVAAARKAASLDPLNARAWTTLGSLLLASGEPAQMREALNRSLEVNPQQAFASSWLGVGLLIEGKPAEALAAFDRSTSDVFRLFGESLSHHSLGHVAESRRALDELIAKHSHDGAYQIASVYTWRGEKDTAFEWLDRACAQHDGGLTLIQLDPVVRNLRGDSRYRSVLARMNLAAD